MYLKNQLWIEKREKKIKDQQEKIAKKEKEDLTFQPRIKNMISEAAIQREHLNAEQLQLLRPEVTIPQDTQQSRLVVKSVPGMIKYLQKQFKGMVKREE